LIFSFGCKTKNSFLASFSAEGHVSG
jgi:hypothetical protein